MAKLSKDYFTNKEVLVVGYPMKADPSMQMILKEFLNNGIKVFALNEQAGGDAGIKVYRSLEELPKVPECAYMYAEKIDIDPWIGRLAAAGVKRVLYHSKRDVDPGQLEETRKAGMEAAVACPMMLLAKGIHRFHGKLAGVL